MYLHTSIAIRSVAIHIMKYRLQIAFVVFTLLCVSSVSALSQLSLMNPVVKCTCAVHVHCVYLCIHVHCAISTCTLYMYITYPGTLLIICIQIKPVFTTTALKYGHVVSTQYHTCTLLLCPHALAHHVETCMTHIP